MVASAQGVDGQAAARTRLVESAAALFSRNGYAATGVKAVLADASSPYGSLYHWFPGGKQQLGVAALEYGGARYRELLESVYPQGRRVVEATAASFVMAAELLEQSDFDYSCPIATIALEVSSSDEMMRAAAAAADRARDVAEEILALLEGSLLLARTTRTTKPPLVAGRSAANAVATGLAANALRSTEAAVDVEATPASSGGCVVRPLRQRCPSPPAGEHSGLRTLEV